MAADRMLSGPGAEGGAPQSQGKLIGRRYRLMSPVGRGGMGMVWHAHDVLLDRDVAVKELILPFGLDHAGKQAAHRRVLREARSAARLQHPGIVTVHDVVEEDGRPWIVMELVRAWSLEQAVRQSGPLPVVQAAEIGIRVLDALRHAHAAGILHRDIKPGNVLLTADRVVLTDFGIAAVEGDVTITQTGLLMGSPAYIPPERLSGQPISAAADLWSFGATLYTAVEGRPPYEGPDAVAVLGAVLTQEPSRPQRAGALLPVIEGLLRKNPAERLTAEEATGLLERVLLAHGSARPRNPEAPAPLPAPDDPAPSGPLLMEPPSGPLPSRIVETPSGPVRVPYDPDGSLSGGYAMPYDAMPGPSGAHRTDQVPRPDFDAFASGPHSLPGLGGSASQRSLSDPAPGARPGPGSVSGPYPMPPQDVRGPAGAMPDGPSYPGVDRPAGPGGPGDRAAPPILPLTSDSRSAGVSSRWPLATDDDLRDQSHRLSRDVSRSRLAQLPGGGPHRTAAAGGRRPQESGNAWVRDGRPTPLLIVAAVAAVVAVVAALMILASIGSDEPSPAPLSIAGGVPTRAEASPVPDGYSEETPPGFSAGVPEGWKVSSSGGQTTITGPKDSGIRLVVTQVPPREDGGLAELTREEADGGKDGYIQVQLQNVGYRGWKATDWEYTYASANEVPMHALTRFVTLDEETAFTITFDMPELVWDDQAEARRVFFDTFRQSS
ncbi:protein kinase [Nonomuraea sp. MCN248]|uniref:non-specific serine/threonine protein kinase n=1 Tax=Nonomuraea corallina TaxID=2989783 RepID=A0ABT4SMC9_9ACTN|nr:serine/threonine-protein kinase [Nonomuraea corallina]MDA0638230.1 protein kinase [Nonomuraea corallina]